MTQFTITPDIDVNLLKILMQSNLRLPDQVVIAGNLIKAYTGEETIIASIIFLTDLTPAELALLNALAEKARSKASFNNLPNWATFTADEAETSITNAIFNGQTQAQVEAAITAAITGAPNTVAGVKTVMNTLFIQAADQIIAIRGILIIFGKILVWLRNIVLNKL